MQRKLQLSLPGHRFLQLCLAMAAVLWLAFGLMAQGFSSAPQITGVIKDEQRVVLKGNTYPLARAEYDRGRASPDLAMGDLVLVLKRSPEQQAAFDAFVASQYDKASPNFHRWLRPEEVGEKFGPAQSDVEAISNWLRKHGFSIDEVSNDRMFIRFSGTVAQVESTFHTEIHNLEVNGEKHIANMTDPQIPLALTPVVVGVKALHNFFPRTMHRMGSQVILDRDRSKWQRVPRAPDSGASGDDAALPAGPLPEFSGSSYSFEDITPYDFATIYNVIPLWNQGIDGTGQTIAIAGKSNIYLNDIATFRSAFGLPANAPTIIITNSDPGTGNSDDLGENTLDVEWAGAVAKGADIDLVTSCGTSSNNPCGASATTDGGWLSAIYIVETMTPTPNIMSYSYGLCELGLGSSGNSAFNSLWQAAASEGIAVFVATGDSGSAMCDAGNKAPYFAEYGLMVNGAASTPYDTAVGGTDLNWTSNPSAYWSSTNNSTTQASALGYVPEVPWNQSCINPIFDIEVNNAIGENFSASAICYDIANAEITSSNDEAALQSLVNAAGAGGGNSNCAVTETNSNGTSCVSGYGKPSWQTGVTGIPADGARDIPDVSFFASDSMLGSAYLICLDSASGECNAVEVGGTSASSPAMAGVMALINQKAGAPQGNPNTELYTLAGEQSYSSCSAENVPLNPSATSCNFNDIDTGTNAVPCNFTSGMNCIDNYEGFGELAGWSATPGYDLATGLGSLNVANVVNSWPSVTPNFSLSAPGLSFGSQPLSTTSPAQAETVTNTGTGNLTISTVTISGTNASDFAVSADFCTGATVTPNSTCTVSVTFDPSATGSRSASLNFTDNASGSPQTVNLTGTGVTTPVPVAGVSPGSLTFSNQTVGTTSTSQPVTLSNTGTAALTISNIGTSANFGESNNCGGSVATSGSCTINVTFTPTATGTLTGTLTITDNSNGVAGSTQTVILTGTGVTAAPVAGVSPSSLTFSNQGVGTTSASQPVTLSNTGNAALTITNIGTSSNFGETNNCGTSVAAGGSCTINVTFTPTATGTLTGTLTITDNSNGVAGSTQSVTLSGTGQDFSFAAASGSPTSATVAPGAAVGYALSVAGVGGFNQSVSFACSGAPSEATCTVSPNPVTAGSSATNVTVTVTTTAASLSVPRSRPLPPAPPLSPGLRSLSMLALVLALMAWAMGRRNLPGVSRWRSTMVPLAAGLLLTLALAAGCGGGGSSSNVTHNPGTPAGTYTLTVTGTAGSGSSALSHSVTLTLTVS